MILLFLDSLLLLFIATNLGIIFQKGLESVCRIRIQTDLLGIFLTGLIVSTIYFNILSFWLPVNYLLLLPLLAISLFVFLRWPNARPWFSLSRQWPFQRIHWLPVLCLFILLFCYWIKPPTNADGPGYHYLSILWYEKFKAVPGLGNLHGRFGFNPVSFIIESAYSFTPLTGQAIYPLNGVLSCLFLCWILLRLLRHVHSAAGLVYFALLIVFLRLFLANISSPTSDLLSHVCVGYALIRFFEYMLARKVGISTIFLPVLVLLFAPAVKLSAYPAGLALILVLFVLPKMEKKIPFLITLTIMGLLIYLPWMGRNYILSGYPIYPAPWLDFFHPDWKVPADVARTDYYRIIYGAKFDLDKIGEWKDLQTIHFRDWFFPWFSLQFHNKLFIELALLISAIGSPLLWVILFVRRKGPPFPLFLLWLIVYAGSWVWLMTSPDFRYGTIFLSLACIFPLLLLTGAGLHSPDIPRTGSATAPPMAAGSPYPINRPPGILLSLLFIGATLYYVYGAYTIDRDYTRITGHSLQEGWLLPLKDARYSVHNSIADFPYRIMDPGIKLWLSDPTHECLNAGLPCMKWEYNEIEMRGMTLDQGFRNTKSEMWKAFPFLR